LDGSGAIGVTELEDPLLALGLTGDRAEVQKLMDLVDDDKTGEIEFNEFLLILRTLKSYGDGTEQRGVYEFFRAIIRGQAAEIDKNVPFRLGFSMYRRKRILDAIMLPESVAKEKGKRVLDNFKLQLLNRAKEKCESGGGDPSLITMWDIEGGGDLHFDPTKGFGEMTGTVKPKDPFGV
jgi:centrin-2